jgi:quinolinate synthase
MNTLEKLYNCLLNETPEIAVKKETAEKAISSIERMLALS